MAKKDTIVLFCCYITSSLNKIKKKTTGLQELPSPGRKNKNVFIQAKQTGNTRGYPRVSIPCS